MVFKVAKSENVMASLVRWEAQVAMFARDHIAASSPITAAGGISSPIVVLTSGTSLSTTGSRRGSLCVGG